MRWVFHSLADGSVSGTFHPDSSGVIREWDPRTLSDVLARPETQLAPGGVVAARLLRRTANPDPALAALVDAGVLRRVRRGWYASPGAAPEVVAAVAAGGVLSCLSALAFHGVWAPLHDGVHARPARTGVRLGPAVHECSLHLRGPAPLIAVDPPDLALRVAARCLSREDLVACADSALHLGLLSPRQVAGAVRGASSGAARSARRVDVAESGTESLVRLRLRSKRVRVRTQVVIDGVGRVDMLLGRCVVLEVDSRAHHTDAESYQRDRLRDLKLLARGYVVIRVTWEQVMFGWADVEPLILAALALHDG